MRRVVVAMLLACCLVSPGRAVAFNSGNAVAADMANVMWEFMQWFLGGGVTYPGSYSAPFNHWYFPYTGPGRPGYYTWQDPWLYPQVLDGVWLADSGEYWLIKGGGFILMTPDGRRFDGGIEHEGPFLHVRLGPQVREFAYQQRQDVLLLHDVDGRRVTLRRIRRPQWNW